MCFANLCVGERELYPVKSIFMALGEVVLSCSLLSCFLERIGFAQQNLAGRVGNGSTHSPLLYYAAVTKRKAACSCYGDMQWHWDDSLEGAPGYGFGLRGCLLLAAR